MRAFAQTARKRIADEKLNLLVSTPPPTLSALDKLKSCHKLWLNNFQNFPRLHRSTLGSKINVLFLEILESLFVAGFMAKEQKILQVAKTIKSLDLLKFFCQLAWEAKMLENKKYGELAEALNGVGRMLGGWHKQLTK